MRYCIIDDEPIAHRIIESYAGKVPYLQKVGNCYDAFTALQLLREEVVDLIFLDINMPELSGFELLKTLVRPPKVIVTSAHREFALEGYELNVSDYLLKPFAFERFVQALNKLTVPQSPQPRPTDANSTTRFFLKGDKKTHQIHAADILFIEAFGNYTKVFLKEEKLIGHEKISTLEALLDPAEFIRVHKSFIVAVAMIKSIEGNRIRVGEHLVPIGQTYRRQVRMLLDR